MRLTVQYELCDWLYNKHLYDWLYNKHLYDWLYNKHLHTSASRLLLTRSWIFFLLTLAGPRVQTNTATAYIDSNFLYGSNVRLGDELRLLKRGLMKTLPAFSHLGLKDLMPLKLQFPDDGCTRSSPDVYCFLAGSNPMIRLSYCSCMEGSTLYFCAPVNSHLLDWPCVRLTSQTNVRKVSNLHIE